jgi:hypothetical protein
MKKDIIIIVLMLILIIFGIHEINTLSKKDTTLTASNNEKNYITDDDKPINVANSNKTNNIVSNTISNTNLATEDIVDDYENVTHMSNPNYITYNEEDLKKEDAYFDENGVNIEVIEDSITRTSCKIRITNSGGDPGAWYSTICVEKKEGENWQEAKLLPLAAQSNNLSETGLYYFIQTINWKERYGELEPGIYRIKKLPGNLYDLYDPNIPGYYSNEFEIK